MGCVADLRTLRYYDSRRLLLNWRIIVLTANALPYIGTHQTRFRTSLSTPAPGPDTLSGYSDPRVLRSMSDTKKCQGCVPPSWSQEIYLLRGQIIVKKIELEGSATIIRVGRCFYGIGGGKVWHEKPPLGGQR